MVSVPSLLTQLPLYSSRPTLLACNAYTKRGAIVAGAQHAAWSCRSSLWLPTFSFAWYTAPWALQVTLPDILRSLLRQSWGPTTRSIELFHSRTIWVSSFCECRQELKHPVGSTIWTPKARFEPRYNPLAVWMSSHQHCSWYLIVDEITQIHTSLLTYLHLQKFEFVGGDVITLLKRANPNKRRRTMIGECASVEHCWPHKESHFRPCGLLISTPVEASPYKILINSDLIHVNYRQ